jgi:hypothetical protein
MANETDAIKPNRSFFLLKTSLTKPLMAKQFDAFINISK